MGVQQLSSDRRLVDPASTLGMELSPAETMQIAPKQRSAISSILYRQPSPSISSSPAPCPKLSDYIEENEMPMKVISNLIISTNEDTLSVPIRLSSMHCNLNESEKLIETPSVISRQKK